MNLLLAYPEELKGEQLQVRGRRASHVHRVLNAKPGERIKLGLLRRSVGTAEVLLSEDDVLLLGDLQMQPAGPAPTLRLVIALPRPKALRRLLQTAASFQVGHVDIVNAWRVQKSYWDSPAIEAEALNTELLLGCEQGRHVWLPTIECHRLFVPFIDGDSLNGATGPRLIAHPGSETWLRDVDTSESGAVIAIGPEGGWIANELASFEAIGFERVAISKAILRSEIALAATLAQWELLTS